ncbi:MAG: hypothetical protein ACE5I4_03940 [Thermoplasmata archaeon]
MNRKLVILVVAIVAIVAIVAVFLVPLLLGGFGPPVDVYARPTPSTSASPESLLPGQVAGGNQLLSVVTDQGSGWVDAIGTYEGNIEIEITLWTFSGDATAYLSGTAEFWRDRSGSTTSAQAGEVHWFTHNESGLSIFGWRKDVWTFEVYAPNATMRNQVVEELPF